MADNARLNSTSSSAEGSAVGRELKEAREALGITIPQMADTLRIRAAHIAALEEGRFNDLPGRPYAFGFARSIARHLGLDPEVVASRLRDEVMGTSAPVELVFPESTEDKRLSRTGWVLISLFAVVVAYGAWVTVGARNDNHPAEFSDAPASQAVPEQIVPSPDAEPSTSEPTDSAASSQSNAQAPASTPSAPGAPMTAAPAESEDDVDVTPEPSDSAGAPSPATAPNARIIVRAREDSWIQIQSSNGAVVFGRVLRAGETYPVPDQRGLRLTTGNAGGIDLVVDGQALPSLGQTGAVRRNVALDADRLKTGALE